MCNFMYVKSGQNKLGKQKTALSGFMGATPKENKKNLFL